MKAIPSLGHRYLRPPAIGVPLEDEGVLVEGVRPGSSAWGRSRQGRVIPLPCRQPLLVRMLHWEWADAHGPDCQAHRVEKAQVKPVDKQITRL